MGIGQSIVCDGCGQPASSEHLAARFRRLEWSTRYRPLHVNTLVLGAVVPENDAEFIYSDATPFSGEAAQLLKATGVDAAGKTAEVIHHEFQRAGFFVVHLLDCPVGRPSGDGGHVRELLSSRLATTFTRIRKSIKPRRLALVGAELDPFVEKFKTEALGCPLILNGDTTFKLHEAAEGIERLRSALALSPAAMR
jgi:hypothetical protein